MWLTSPVGYFRRVISCFGLRTLIVLPIQCIMPKKTRQHATQVWNSGRFELKFYKNNGTRIDSFGFSSVPTINRRFGATSTIVDQTGRDGRFRPVTHTSERYVAVPVGSLQNFQYSDWKQGNTPSAVYKTQAWGVLPCVHSRFYSTFTDAVSLVDPSLAMVQWNSLAASAIQAMLPSFHNSNSLVNFLLELKDFRSVVKLIGSRFGQKLDRINSYRLKMPDGTYKQVFRGLPRDKTLKWLSKRYLEYNFGWRPLYRDVVSLLKEVTGFHARYQELIGDADKPVQKHWRTVVSGTSSSETRPSFDDVGSAPTTSYEGSWAYRVKRQVVLEASNGVIYNATLRMRYKVPPELSAAGGQAKAWLDLLGVSRNPAILWNAIPFSFLVDWVVGIGSFLDRFRTDNIQFQTEIMDFCHSAKFMKRVRYDLAVVNQNSAGVYFSLPWVTTDSCEISRYERKVGYPDLNLALQTSGLNAREITLAGALFSARNGH